MIIRTNEDVTQFLSDINQFDIFIHPIFSDTHKHFKNNKLSLLYVYAINSDIEYILVFNHFENDNVEYDIKILNELKNQNVYCINKKELLYVLNFDNIYDLKLYNYLHTNNNDDDDYETNAHNFVYNKYYKYKNINNLVPIIKHLEYCTSIKNKYVAMLPIDMDNVYTMYNNALNDFYIIENNGICYDDTLFRKYFDNKYVNHANPQKLLHSCYNLNTSTGRPSNSFGGINFAALNKSTGERKMIVSRFDNGALVELDFNAYHLRLIAKLTNYKFPDNINVHEYLAKYYFDKDIITPEDYNNSKTLTFRALYSGFFKKYDHIPFYKIVNEYIYNIWSLFKVDGYISSINNRKIKKEYFDDINKTKLFNYLIQLTETEENIIIIKKINTYLNNKNTKLILYTYDSFLFDVDLNENFNVVEELENIITETFPASIKIGKNYQELKNKK